MLAALLFTLGLIIGSFLNVVAFRYSPKSGFNWSGRSRCLKCGATLKWYELIPVVSFIIQGGKCRHCGVKISWQYLLVELSAGFIFLLLYPSTIWILASLIFLLIWAIDYRLYIIPDELNIGLAILGVGRIFLQSASGQFGEFTGSFLGSYAGLFGLRQCIWLNHFSAALIAAVLFGLIIYVTKGRGMGMGDLKLAAALGLLFGWPDILLVIILAFLIGSLISVALVVFGKKGIKGQVPFGPFLILGSLAVFFFGESILRAYFNFFGL